MATTLRRRFRLGDLLLAAAVLTLGLLASPHAAYALSTPKLVQRRLLHIKSGSNIAVKLIRPNRVGDLLIAYLVWDGGGSASLGDSQGNVFQSAVGPTADGSGSIRAQIFYATNVAAGSNVVTARLSSPIGARGALYVQEFSGIAASSPLESVTEAAGSGPAVDSGLVDVAGIDDLVFMAAASTRSLARVMRGYRTLTRSFGGALAYQVVAGAGAYHVTATQSGSGWVMQLAVFKALGSDSSAPTVPADLQASNVTSSSATISWSPSSDDVGVAGYRVFRNGNQISTTSQTHYTDPSLSPATTYQYAVTAYDAAGHVSAASAPPLDVTTTSGAAGVAYPLKVGASGRYLVDQNDVPFLIAGDSPQALIVNLSEAEAEAFFADRQAGGFNVVWINLLCATYTGGRADGSTYDGIVPFTTSNDLATPNESYFARVDDMLSLAAQHGLTVLLDPAETGSFLSVLDANGVAKARDYGRYLGNRYRSFDNIVWMSGNDFQSWPNAGDDAVVRAVALGIRDTDDRHIHTVELDYPVSGSLDDASWAPIIQLNASYTYYPTYAQVLADYNRANAIPTFLVEANYEFEHNVADLGTPEILRRQAYWSLLSGAAGQLYGNRYTWPFIAGWQSNLDTPGSLEMSYVKFLFEQRQWYNLIPDQSHAVVTAGNGTFADSGALGDNDYLTAARTPDGSLVIAYMPTRRSITVNMAKLGAAAFASWYDPSNGTFSAIAGSPFANGGMRVFTPPGNNGAGDGDWVLLLEATSVPPDTEAPSVPSGLSASNLGASQVTISWAPSSDNVAVAGYRVYRDGALLKTTASTSYDDAGLSSLTTYHYTVAAFDYANNPSAPSPALPVTTTAPAPSFVQQAFATPQTAQSVVTATYAAAQAAGNANIVAIGWNDTSSTLVSVTDSAGNVYHPAIATFRGNGLSQAIYYAAGIAAAGAGANQVIATFDQPATFVDLRVAEYAGIRTTSPFDVGKSASGSGTTASTPSLTVATPPELLFAAGMTSATFTAPGASFTSRVVTSPDGDIVQDAIAASAGSYGATASLSSGTWLLQLAAFRSP